MSYTLETKKRKFTRVLESLSKPLAPGDGRAKTPKDPITAARERLADAANTPPSIKRVRVVGEGIGDKLTTRTTLSRTVQSCGSSSNLRPNFVPWDRDRFLERLETFRPVTRWTSQPAPINEVEWAKRGWTCTDYMRVACVGGCGASIVVKLPEEVVDFEEMDSETLQERADVRQKVVDEYRKLLSDGHKETCLWRNKACDATIHRLPLSNPDIAINALQERYSKTLKMKEQLPAQETIELPDQFSLEETIKLLAANFAKTSSAEPSRDNNNTPSSEVDHVSFAFAFFGWDVVKDGSSGLLECRACFRRLGLWLYKPKAEGEDPVYEKLPVHTEHMDYCPWINGTAQSATGTTGDKPESLLSGWQILAQGIRTKHRRQQKATTSTPDAATPPRESGSLDPDTFSLDSTATDEAAQRAKDREWWSKLRRVRETLHIKGFKKSALGDS